jgi:hypothetical protein
MVSIQGTADRSQAIKRKSRKTSKNMSCKTFSIQTKEGFHPTKPSKSDSKPRTTHVVAKCDDVGDRSKSRLTTGLFRESSELERLKPLPKALSRKLTRSVTRKNERKLRVVIDLYSKMRNKSASPSAVLLGQ